VRNTSNARGVPEPDLSERSDALSWLDPLLDRLCDGRGGSVFVVAEAGLGKTTVLRQSEMRATSWAQSRMGGCRVGRAEGRLFGPEQPFRFADQIFASLGVDVTLGATGSQPEARPNRFLSALHALDDCSSRSPLLLFLDDLHWADLDSLAILEFLCRQISTRPVAMIGTLRPWPAAAMDAGRRLELDGLASSHHLEPLSPEASIELLSSRVSPDVGTEVLAQALSSCNGNRLLIEEVARSLIGGWRVPAIEPVSGVRRALLLRKFAGVSDDTFRFLRAASALGETFWPSVAARMVGFDAPRTDIALEEAGAAGIFETQGVSVRFVHPILRSALYDAIPDPLRNELHEAAFRAIRFAGGGAAEAAEHAVAAGLTDEVAYSVMRRAGQEALGSGSWADARRLLGHAVRAAGEHAGPDMIREAAEADVADGSPREAVDRLQAILSRPDVEGLQRGRALVVLGEAQLSLGKVKTAVECFEDAARILEPVDRGLSVDALLRCAFNRFFVGPRESLAFSERALALSQGMGRGIHLQIDAARGYGAMMLGSNEGFELLARTAATIENDSTVFDDSGDGAWWCEGAWWPLVWCSSGATFSEQFAAAQRAFELGFSAAERRGWPGAMGAHLVIRIDLMIRQGQLDEAELELDRLESLVAQAPVLGPVTMVMRTGIDVELGRLVEAETGCRKLERILEAIEHPPPTLALWVMRIRGKLDLAQGRTAEACAAFERAELTAVSSGVVEPCIVPWWMPALDGYRQAGRLSDLKRVVTWLEEVSRGLPCRWPRAGALAGRAMLDERAGDLVSANRNFERARAEMERVQMPLERAALLVWYGAFLRRQGDLTSARPVLSTAFRLADSRGAGLCASEARSELRQAGGRLSRASRDSESLTQRESQVALLASAGRTSSQIAEELGIATRTVEHHLESVYRKKGVRTRRELMRKKYEGDLDLNPEVEAGTNAPIVPDAGARP
jgi:DNA-binding CsgD family transcriptional regulator